MTLPRYWIVALVLFFGEAWAQDQHDPLRFVTLWAGTLPIILSAPHGGREAVPGIAPRRGHEVPQFTTGRDSNTAELAEQVGAILAAELEGKPFLVVAWFERKYIDANRAPAAAYETPAAKLYYDGYHQALGEACRSVQQRWEHGLLLDLHGQGAEPETIFRGTNNGKSVSDLERRFGRGALTGSQSIFGQLALKGYKVAPNGAGNELERRYTGGFTTQTYGSHRGTGIDAIQLELGTALRQRANLKQTAVNLAAAIAVFARRYLPLASGETRGVME